MRLFERYVLPQLINRTMRDARFDPYRRRVLSQANGRVLEIGVGSGLNLPLYTNRAEEVVGIDPVPELLSMASRKTFAIPSTLIKASAESIPLDSRSVDTVVTTWTMCSIPNVDVALQEMRRVLRPGGKLLFIEHGLSTEDGVRRWQHRLTPFWKHVAGGCRLDRPISVLVQNAGFKLARLETSYLDGPRPMTFTYEGVAHPD